MSDRDFKRFLEEVQVSAVSDAPLPRMSDKNQAVQKEKSQSAALAGSKRLASKAESQKQSAGQASKRSKR